MDTEKLERLTMLSHLLEGAGSDSAFVTLNSMDADLLGIIGSKEMREIETRELKAVDGNPQNVIQKAKVPCVKRNEVPGSAVKPSYEVLVGFAREALEIALDGNRIIDEKRVMPEPALAPAAD